MASLADVFTEPERTNWLKAWLAIDIAKSGIEQFAENEAKLLHGIIYNAILTSGAVACTVCHTANLLKCPSPGICNKRGAYGLCKSMHDTASKQPIQCPANVCNKVVDKITNNHRFPNPSWKNTEAIHWASNPWQIAKAYFPPDGYTGKSSAHDTDLNGIISFMQNCKTFDSKFSFPIARTCILTKVRDIGKTVRHSSTCKVTDTDLNDIFNTLTSLLTDPKCLAHDVAAQEAVRKLAKLQTDILKLTTEEIVDLLEAAQNILKKVEHITETVIEEMRIYIENCRKELREHTDKCKEELSEHTGECKEDLSAHTGECKEELSEHTVECKEELSGHTDECKEDLSEHTGECKEELSEHTGECKEDLSEHTGECKEDLSEHTGECKEDLCEHTGKCKQEFDEHCRKSTESNYEQSCKEFRRRLIAHYSDTSSNVPLSNLDQSLDKRIADIYATPQIHRIEIEKDGKHVQKEKALTYKQIFYTDEHLNRRIYIQGEPGSGKSTFSAKLVLDWSHGNQHFSASPSKTTAFEDVSTIQKFKFLFFITLRNSRGQTDVTQMIKKQIIDTTFSEDERADVYKHFVKIINTEICLIVREGLDEWVAPDGINLAEPSMAGLKNDMCTILTTSRPWKLADERIKNSQIDRLLEIQGISNPYAFSENILRCLIDQTKKDLKETSKKFQSFVEYSELEWLSTSPMLYTLVIRTWEEGNLKGSSRCALYTTLLESMCKKANDEEGYFNDSCPPPVHCFSSTSYIQPNIEHLDKLAEVACKLLYSCERESSIVFDDITLSNYFPLDEFKVRKTFALNAGILTKRKDKSRTGSSNSFVHKTVQELLAAYHIACNPSVIDDLISRYLKLNNTSHLEISQVLIFLCGMNISAANKLSALMNQYEVNHCDDYPGLHWGQLYPCEFQRIIESGIREAAANNQDDIQLKLSHFCIDEFNIRDLHDIWSTNTSNAQVFGVLLMRSYSRQSLAEVEPRSQFEFDLSSCHKLRKLHLTGGEILIRDTASSPTWEFPVWIVLNSSCPVQRAYPPLVLPCIQDIRLACVTCSSTWLRSLFSMLLTLNHLVTCELEYCYITSCVEGSNACTSASISTRLNELVITYVQKDSIGLWEALCGLNIKSLTLDVQRRSGLSSVDHAELMSQCLSSLIQLETLSICVKEDSPGLWEALCGLNIKSLSVSGMWSNGLIVDHVELMSQCLSSLTQLETLSICVDKDSPGLWEALCGLNIKSLSVSGMWSNGLIVDHVEMMSQCLSSLTQLETLSICVDKDSPGLWEALCGLNIKSLSVSGMWSSCLSVDHVELMSQCLSSLTQLETLSISVVIDSPDLWEALCGLNIKSLRLDVKWSRGLGVGVDHVELMSQCLSSLIQLETLSICVDKDSPGLWEALCGLNIKSLSLDVKWSRGLSVDHPELMSQCLSLLIQLETLSICVAKDSPGLWEALCGLNIKSLSVSGSLGGLSVDHAESLSQCLLSLAQLETFTIYVSTYLDMQLPQSLKYFNFYCHELHRSELRDLLNTMSVCTQSVEIRLEFGCTSCVHVKNTPQEEEYIDIQEQLKNVIVKRFRIYDKPPGSHIWSVRDIGGVDEDDHHHDSVNNKMHDDFLRSFDYK